MRTNLSNKYQFNYTKAIQFSCSAAASGVSRAPAPNGGDPAAGLGKPPLHPSADKAIAADHSGPAHSTLRQIVEFINAEKLANRQQPASSIGAAAAAAAAAAGKAGTAKWVQPSGKYIMDPMTYELNVLISLSPLNCVIFLCMPLARKGRRTDSESTIIGCMIILPISFNPRTTPQAPARQGRAPRTRSRAS